VRYLAVRHGESTWNAAGLWQGQANPPLSPEGLVQASLLADRLAADHIDVIFASDLDRAMQTAQAVAEAHGIDVVPRADLRERDVGGWAGLTRAEISTRFPDEWVAYLRHEDPRPGGGGETTADLHSRIRSAFADIRSICREAGWHSSVVVSHGGPTRAIAYASIDLEITAGAPPVMAAPGNTAVAEIHEDGRGLRLVTYNDTAHLLAAGDPGAQTALDP
jgi:probable phosphoglycerate mutase